MERTKVRRLNDPLGAIGFALLHLGIVPVLGLKENRLELLRSCEAVGIQICPISSRKIATS